MFKLKDHDHTKSKTIDNEEFSNAAEFIRWVFILGVIGFVTYMLFKAWASVQ